MLPTFDENSIDAIVTDPPYELGFMGKKWDASGIAYNVELWRECLRVLKPGGHLLAFGGTRTYHRMTVAIEDAGFEIRDSIHWIYSSGFPKSLDVSKAIDKAAGQIGEIVGERRFGKTSTGQNSGWNANAVAATGRQEIRALVTDNAKKWNGWGTALKPAHEPIVLARKPLQGTVANNVLEHGTGALNIDGTRVKNLENQNLWPANIILNKEMAEHNPEWANYFYCSKPSKKERNAGLEKMEPRFAPTMNNGIGGKEHDPQTATPKNNFHPTVKPLALMRYLVRLITPPHGTVLDPFAGSGTTLAAAIIENKNAIGIELTEDYLPLIESRCYWAMHNNTPTLFDN